MVFVCFFELGNRHGGLVGWLEDGRQCSKCSSVSRISWYGGATSIYFPCVVSIVWMCEKIFFYGVRMLQSYFLKE